MKYVKAILMCLGLVLVSVFAFTGLVNAQSFKGGETVTVAKGEMVDSMLFAGGSSIDIAGTVNGDLYCAGQSISISGVVNGDVICAGQNIQISGKISGDARLASQSVTISGRVEKSATIATQTLTIDKSGSIGRDLIGGSQNIMINGSVSRDIVSGSTNLTINGIVGRNIKGETYKISVGSSGQVNGNVEYTGNSDPTISEGGHIKGTVKRVDLKENESTWQGFVISMIWLLVFKLIAMLIFSVVLLFLAPKIFEKSTSEAMKSPGQTFLVGAAATFIAPILIIALLMTIVGIPLAMLVILLWIVIVMLICPFAGYTLGKVLFSNKIKKPVWIMVSGVSIFLVLSVIPIIGFITMLIAYLFGTGMLLTQGKKLLFQPKLKKS